jgi:hypothetical protein
MAVHQATAPRQEQGRTQGQEGLTMTSITQRDPLDRYYTPHGEGAIDLLMPHLPIYDRLHILEPCTGLGALVEPLERRGHTVTTADLDPHSTAKLRCDAGAHPWPSDTYDGIITNPPFADAPRLIRHMRDVPRHFAAYLLRLSFLEVCGNRADLIAPYQGLWKVVVTPRYNFKGDGHDSVTTAWFVWQRGFAGVPAIYCEPYQDKTRQEVLL